MISEVRQEIGELSKGRSQMRKRWTIALVCAVSMVFAVEVGRLHSRALVSMMIGVMHGGGLPMRMWVPAQGSQAARKAGRVRPNLVAPAIASPPIEFLGTESYLAGEDAPYWGSGQPFLALKRESDCSLSAYWP